MSVMVMLLGLVLVSPDDDDVNEAAIAETSL
jgi:hypothetical protein